MASTNPITPCLWFDSQAEEAAGFYVLVFKNSAIRRVTRYGKEGFEVHGRPAGSVISVDFRLDGRDFVAINGGPLFKFSEAISFQVFCDTQEEIDYFWTKLTEGGGEESYCGWLKDRFGLSWQVVPSALPELLSDPERSDRVTKAFLQMRKFDIEALKKA